jgi:hypothetical protein
MRCGVRLPAEAEKLTEHRVLGGHGACGKRHVSRFPEEVTQPVAYEAAIQGAAVYLTQYRCCRSIGACRCSPIRYHVKRPSRRSKRVLPKRGLSSAPARGADRRRTARSPC